MQDGVISVERPARDLEDHLVEEEVSFRGVVTFIVFFFRVYSFSTVDSDLTRKGMSPNFP